MQSLLFALEKDESEKRADISLQSSFRTFPLVQVGIEKDVHTIFIVHTCIDNLQQCVEDIISFSLLL